MKRSYFLIQKILLVLIIFLTVCMVAAYILWQLQFLPFMLFITVQIVAMVAPMFLTLFILFKTDISAIGMGCATIRLEKARITRWYGLVILFAEYIHLAWVTREHTIVLGYAVIACLFAMVITLMRRGIAFFFKIPETELVD